MDTIQAFVNGMSAQWQKDRAATQMTLGKMIKQLETMPSGAMIDGLGELDSYRGYYSDLAFEPKEGRRPVNEVLAQCREAMGQVYEGYKGGEYMMGALTPLWVASYGCCGKKLMAINEDGSLELADDD